VLQQLDLKGDHFTADDLRNQVVYFMAVNHEAMFLSQAEQLRATYGGRREQRKGEKQEEQKDDEDETPGPFSYKEYLTFMLQDKSWGDQTVLMAIAMMWDIKLTVLNSHGYYTLTFRHHKTLDGSDMVLVYNGVNHFNPAGQLLVIFGVYYYCR
jgi:hypothetical protein